MNANGTPANGDLGTLTRIAGPVVAARGLTHSALYDVVYVGAARLAGEVIRLADDVATIQVYEDTSGLRVGEPVEPTGAPLQVELGPGLLGVVYDGTQRPLELMARQFGPHVQRGAVLPALDRERRWPFVPLCAVGDHVAPGDVLGTVQETEHFVHHILVPPDISGDIKTIESGMLRVLDSVAAIRAPGTGATQIVRLASRWPVRQRRPYARRLDPAVPLVTGQRVIDTFFPIARGGTAIIPGGFGTGKTVLEQTLAKWVDADVVIYIGCGERGNEMTEVLEEFPRLMDPRNSASLMQRTVLIANTSNMPVAAREASIYTGITIGEYFRDMGYDVAMMADSTSRWGEALREVSGRLEEMPGEEGYPAYLAARLAEFYERAGRVQVLGSRTREGSLSVIGAVSPPGADFSEPMTQNSLRVAGTFWALDYELSRQRHFPAINWIKSYSLFKLADWFAKNVAPEWDDQIRQAMALLQREAELLEIAQLVGTDALPEPEKALLEVARLLREDFLQQYAHDGIDAYCPPDKQFWMLRAVLEAHRCLQAAIQRGVPLGKAISIPSIAELGRMKGIAAQEAVAQIQAMTTRLVKELDDL